jgi:hypothetical protein
VGVTGTASADWDLIIRCKGAPPSCASPTLAVPVTPTVPPVEQPPLPPPPIVPPVTDTSPFAFPAQQPPQETDASCRYFQPLCPNDGTCYATLPNCGNPARQSHLFGCYLPMGMLFQSTQSLGGLRLYVPAGLAPAKIRTLCAGGAL